MNRTEPKCDRKRKHAYYLYVRQGQPGEIQIDFAKPFFIIYFY